MCFVIVSVSSRSTPVSLYECKSQEEDEYQRAIRLSLEEHKEAEEEHKEAEEEHKEEERHSVQQGLLELVQQLIKPLIIIFV